MEENFKLEKEYTLSYNIFKDGYTFFQKKNVYPKSYVFMGIYLIIAVIYIIAAFEDPSNNLAYVLIFLCIALGFREWYNPRKVRRSLLDTVREMGDMNYKIRIDESFIEISTLENENVEKSSDEDNDETENEEMLPPEATKIPLNDDISLTECEEFFILYFRKAVFYIIPKKDWSDSEMQLLRASIPLKK